MFMDGLFHRKMHQVPVRAIVLDDHNLFAESFSKVLESFGYFQSVIYFSSAEELLSYLMNYPSSASTYLFLDYYLREKTIPPVINDIRRVTKNPKIVIVSGTDTPAIIKRLTELNVDGIVHKSSGAQEIISCLQAVTSGTKYYSSNIQVVLQNNEEVQNQLTEREIEILEFFSKGFTVDETAKAIHLSRHTVAAHRRKIFLKTGSTNIAELLHYARKYQLI